MNQLTKNHLNSYRRISLITVIAVYFLILVGGIVRSTGSGMGCPDWPKCFGSLIPPTSVEQLPSNYQEIYLQKRISKNDRFVNTLANLGFVDLAEKISNDKSILIEEEFNVIKTWIEYINRLIGVVIGFLIILTVWKSLPLWKVDRIIPLVSISSLVLVLFQGWIGSLVVSTNLLSWMITFHMLLALALVCLLIYGYHRSKKIIGFEKQVFSFPKKVKWILVLGIILMVVQIVLGTQVREMIDQISFSLGNMLRDEWISRIGIDFLIHRSFSLLILVISILFLFLIFRFSARKSQINNWSQLLLLFVILEIGSGIGMAYFGIPAFLQPIHLLFGSLIVGVQFLLLLQINEHNQLQKKDN
jgi:cytochrome c oxidase assembly protein subunit 15